MSRTPFIARNDDEIDSICCVLQNAIGNPHPQVSFRMKLLRAGDSLEEVVSTAAAHQEDVADEDRYLCLFDALGYLRQGTKWPYVNKDFLQKALERLDNLKLLMSFDGAATA